MVNRGLAYLREQSKRAGNRPDRMLQLWFKSDERAEFWFLNDEHGMYTALVHGVERPGRNGGRPWTADVLCLRDSYDDPRESCPLCVSGAKGPWFRVASLVYVTRVIYLTKREGEGIRPVKRSGSNSYVYQQDINEVRILLMKDRIARQAADIADGISGEGVFGEDTPAVSLMGNPFTVERSGTGAQIVEVLKPLPARPVPPEVLEARVGADERLRQVLEEQFGQDSKRPAVGGDGHDDDIGPVADPDAELEGDDRDLIDF